jgi:hypothetical protein
MSIHGMDSPRGEPGGKKARTNGAKAKDDIHARIYARRRRSQADSASAPTTGSRSASQRSARSA